MGSRILFASHFSCNYRPGGLLPAFFRSFFLSGRYSANVGQDVLYGIRDQVDLGIVVLNLDGRNLYGSGDGA